MMRLFIEPLDVLLFRKSQPFAAGESSRATSAFPPSPVPFQGAIRTAILRGLGLPFERLRAQSQASDPQVAHAIELIGDPFTEGDFGRLRLRGPHLARRKDNRYQVLFPAPRSALWEERTGQLRPLIPVGREQIGEIRSGGGDTSVPSIHSLALDCDGPGEPMQGLWLTDSALCSFLAQERTARVSPLRDEDLFTIERRSGIELDKATRTASKGKLYGIDFIRLQPSVGFLMEVELYSDGGTELADLLPAEGFLHLGGERRVVHYQSVEKTQINEYGSLLSPPSQISAWFTLLFITPAFFRTETPGDPGWIPSWIDKDTMEGGPPGAPRFRIHCAVVGKPIPVGGWDLAKRQPKPLRWAVPAGTMYYCEWLKGNSENIEAYHAKAISELHKEVGMGQVLVGRWPDAR